MNPEHERAVRGKNTDLKEGERMAERLQDGRYRVKFVEHQSSVACRLQKLLKQGRS